jgi:nitrite reductase (NO-forming)
VEGVQTGGQNVSHSINEQPTVTFTLTTGFSPDGLMAFIGVGGEIDGQINPDLKVQPGDVVEIVLVNGDAILHNLALTDFDAQSEDVSQKGAETRVVFKAEQAGEYAYFCNIPGHRQAGMEGKLIVGEAAAEAVEYPSVSLAPDAVPAPIERSAPETVQVELETIELTGRLADGTAYNYFTFNGTVPGPFIRVRQGDTVEVTLKNSTDSTLSHSVDFHAVTGPGGGAVATQTNPGESTHFSFKAINVGLYVYHCATPSVAHHMTNGMYGMILVEPEGGLTPVDREFYVMQGEIYTLESFGAKGMQEFSHEKMLNEDPEYFVLNGSVGALTDQHPLTAKVGETVRIFYGVGGPNATSSFHVIGEIFDRVYDQGSLTAAPLTDVQTTLIPAGGATMVEFTLQVPGRYLLVDHSLSRLERGLVGYLVVEGDEAPDIFHAPGGTSDAGH